MTIRKIESAWFVSGSVLVLFFRAIVSNFVELVCGTRPLQARAQSIIISSNLWLAHRNVIATGKRPVSPCCSGLCGSATSSFS